MTHESISPLAERTMLIAKGELAGQLIRIEDWWDRIAGRSWMVCDGNPACMIYAMRDLGTPFDDEVVYGKVGGMGTLVHVSFLGDEA